MQIIAHVFHADRIVERPFLHPIRLSGITNQRKTKQDTTEETISGGRRRETDAPNGNIVFAKESDGFNNPRPF